MIRTLGLVTALSLVAPAAHAGECHHGGGGGSVGGNGGGSYTPVSTQPIYVGDYDTGGETATTAARKLSRRTADDCTDETDIVGYRRCTKYGAWGSNLRIPHVFIEVGLNMRQFGSALSDQSASVTHGAETFAYRIVMPEAARHLDLASTTDVRGSIDLAHGIYAGLEGELGTLVTPASASAEMMTTGTFGSPEISQGHGLVLGGFAVAGVRGAVRHASLGVELAGGVRSVQYSFDSAYHDCQQSTTITATSPVVEARARAEMFLGPWLTAGATVGTSVIAQHDWLAGIYLGVHSRAYGGR